MLVSCGVSTSPFCWSVLGENNEAVLFCFTVWWSQNVLFDVDVLWDLFMYIRRVCSFLKGTWKALNEISIRSAEQINLEWELKLVITDFHYLTPLAWGTNKYLFYSLKKYLLGNRYLLWCNGGQAYVVPGIMGARQLSRKWGWKVPGRRPEALRLYLGSVGNRVDGKAMLIIIPDRWASIVWRKRGRGNRKVSHFLKTLQGRLLLFNLAHSFVCPCSSDYSSLIN